MNEPQRLHDIPISHVTTRPEDFMNNANPGGPRLRLNRSATLPLTTGWQTVIFNGQSLSNVNTFTETSKNKRRIEYVNETFIFNVRNKQTDFYNYRFDFFYELQGNLLAGLLNMRVQCRFLIPTVQPAVAFPFPDLAEPYIDIFVPGLLKSYRNVFSVNFYTTENINTYGLRFQIRQESASVPMIQLNSCNLVISS